VRSKVKTIATEFFHHLPYSAVGVGAALGLLLTWEKIGWLAFPGTGFHWFHPLHLFLSALVTTAMFWKYEHRWKKAVVIGILGTIPLCTASDILFPYVGATWLKMPVQFHFCVVEEPYFVFPATALGILFGLWLPRFVESLTEWTHLLHVLISSLASLLYLVAFGFSLWSSSIFAVFLITIVSVWIPCCLSDIAFPLICSDGELPKCHHHHA